MLRILMVWASIWPLFILWGIRGNDLVPYWDFLFACVLIAIFPNVILCWRIYIAKRDNDVQEIIVGETDDHRAHLFTYLLAIMLPLYSKNISTYPDLFATLAALVIILFLFWYLNLHYINILFAIMRYNIFTIHPLDDGNPLTGKARVVLISRRNSLASGNRINCYRISDTVYMEIRK